MKLEELIPFLVIGGVVLAVVAATRTPPPIVVGGGGSREEEGEAERLQAAVQLAQIATQRDVAMHQAQLIAQTEQTRLEYERRAREQEAELERRRIEAERKAAEAGASAQFWGTFWSGLFGLVGSVAGIFLGLSDERLYQTRMPYPPYIGPSGQLRALARREYGTVLR